MATNYGEQVAAMNGRERILAAVRREPAGETAVFPLAMTFAARYAGIPYRDYCRRGEKLAAAQMALAERFDFDAVHVTSDAVREASALGAAIVEPEDEVPALAGPLITDRSSLRGLDIPDPLGPNRLREQVEALRILKRESGATRAVFGWVEAPFQLAGIFRGVTPFMMDVLSDPDFVRETLEFTMRVSTEFGLAQIEAGAEFVGVGDAVASLVSKEHYQEFSLPYVRRLVDTLKKKGAIVKYHICGDASRLLELLPETGAHIVTLDYHVDLERARQLLAGRICIKGNLRPLTLLEGSAEDVERQSRRCLAAMAGEPGYIFSPGCEAPRNSPFENIDTMVRAARTWRQG